VPSVFENGELTGERIRDKIADSKKKEIWMGGLLPLGYDVQDRKLIVNAAEAVQVRRIFDAYLVLRSAAFGSCRIFSNGRAFARRLGQEWHIGLPETGRSREAASYDPAQPDLSGRDQS
jgi:DNA invertase Pin-like site-specific DNA recombinase